MSAARSGATSKRDTPALPPFVIAGILAYITTPAIDWAAARSRLPRLLFVLFAFGLFLLFATLIGYLGIPPVAREMTHVFNDFEAVVRELAERLIGSGKISLLGAPMDAAQLASSAANGLMFGNSPGWKR